MKKILVCGDYIDDEYLFCSPTKLCPEAPALVLKPKREYCTPGGAGLVAAQIMALTIPDECMVIERYGSRSTKRRIFADRTLIVRVDKDSMQATDPEIYWTVLKELIPECSAVVCGDYGKGAMLGVAQKLTEECLEESVALFVDAKSDVTPYKGCYAIFPNENEHNGIHAENYQHVIRKLGPKGCLVDHTPVHTKEQHVYDVTGAGDVFLGAFVMRWVGMLPTPDNDESRLLICAEFANLVAGRSVRELGTYVVTLNDIYGM